MKPVPFVKLILAAGLGAAAALAAPRAYANLRYGPEIFSLGDAPARRVAIVFGAGLDRSGGVSPVLYDRVATAAALYRAGKVSVLLFSGDNRTADHNEPQAMLNAALGLGVPESAIVLDYAGRSTYDTCYRAAAIFGVHAALLVTQEFHLPRALFLCNSLGLRAQGVAADRRAFAARLQAYWNMREVFATAAAWWDVNVSHPLPVLGDPMPIAN